MFAAVLDPFGDWTRVQRGLGKPASRSVSRAGFVPAVEVYEVGDALFLQAELPGMRREDVEVSIDDRVLTLSGERKAKVTDDERRYHLRECGSGKFERKFALPDYIDTEQVEAALQDGVLTLTLHKRPELKPRKIEVKAA